MCIGLEVKMDLTVFDLFIQGVLHEHKPSQPAACA